MYDSLTTTYTFSCPVHGETRVVLSRFRRLEELPGPHHPAVFRVEFACGCGHDHPGLVTHDELDWAPLGLQDETTYLNLMTSRSEPIGGELVDLAASHIKAGEWPWSSSAGRRNGRGRCSRRRSGCSRRGAQRPRRPRGALPGVRKGLGEPRVARARRRAVRERSRGRRRAASLPRTTRLRRWPSFTKSCGRLRSTRGA